jgi:ribosomal subunit interface protein
MRINYTGKLKSVTDVQRTKLDARTAKLAKLLDSTEERQAHVILKQVRHLTKAEVTVHYYGHEIVGAAEGNDAFTSLMEALHKLETQVLKLRKKWVDHKRGPVTPLPDQPPAKAVAANAKTKKQQAAVPDGSARIFRPRVPNSAKPMTADEAALSIGKKAAYLLFRDAETDRNSVLIRRPDGHFDLIEG